MTCVCGHLPRVVDSIGFCVNASMTLTSKPYMCRFKERILYIIVNRRRVHQFFKPSIIESFTRGYKSIVKKQFHKLTGCIQKITFCLFLIRYDWYVFWYDQVERQTNIWKMRQTKQYHRPLFHRVFVVGTIFNDLNTE